MSKEIGENATITPELIGLNVEWSNRQVMQLTDKYIRTRLYRLEQQGIISKKEEGGVIGNGQKSYSGKGHKLIHGAPGTVWVEGTDNRLVGARGENWYRDGDNNDSYNVPQYSTFTTNVSPRPVVADRYLIPVESLEIQSYGHEIEMVAVSFDPETQIPTLVDIQNILSILGEYDIPNISPEAWSSQLEYPSQPCNGENLYEHKQKTYKDMQKILKIFDEMGLMLLPIGVIPIGGTEQANIQDPHILHTIMEGIRPHMDNEDNRTPAELLDGFRTNGLHITVKVQPDENGLVGDERLNQIYNLTHGPIAIMMKAFTLNGNYFPDDLENGVLSSREAWRKTLPTAKVGPTYKLSSPETRKSLATGRAPSPERAAMAYGPHNPVGRQKEKAMIEFTIFDMEPCLEKIHALEVMLQQYVHIVDFAVLAGKINELEQSIPEEYRNVFLGVVEDQEEFLKLATSIDQDGYNTMIDLGAGNIRSVGKILTDFLDWISGMTHELNIATHETDYSLSYLRLIIANSKDEGADNYTSYIEGGFGNAGMTTLKVYKTHLLKVGDPILARNLTLRDLALAWRNQFGT